MLAPQAKSVDRRNRDDGMTLPPVNSRSSDAGFPSVLPDTNNIGPERFARQPVCGDAGESGTRAPWRLTIDRRRAIAHHMAHIEDAL